MTCWRTFNASPKAWITEIHESVIIDVHRNMYACTKIFKWIYINRKTNTLKQLFHSQLEKKIITFWYSSSVRTFKSACLSRSMSCLSSNHCWLKSNIQFDSCTMFLSIPHLSLFTTTSHNNLKESWTGRVYNFHTY